MIEQKDLQVTVRDGTKIAIRLYRPEGSGKFPALFAVSPYRYDNDDLPATPVFLWRETGPVAWYVERGYAYVHADTRGTGFSEGEYRFLDRNEQNDLYDVIEWIGTQPWCNGKVGGIGESYYCMAQWFMGIQNPPHLACLGAYDGLNDPYRFMGYPGGIEGNFLSYWYNSSVRVPNLYPTNGDHPRALPHDLFFDVQQHPFYDDWWQERCAAEQLDKIAVPLFSIGVWAKLDLHCAGNILGYQKAQGPKKLFISGTATPFTAQRDFADVAFHEQHLLPFYERYLKDQPSSHDTRAAVEYTVRNTGAVKSAATWPPPGATATSFFLAKGPSESVTSLNDGTLASAAPGDDGGSASYTYPHPSWALGVVALGPQGPDPVRGVLTFTTAPLPADMEIAGDAKLVLYASSTQPDMDFCVKLSEQFAQDPAARGKGLQPNSFIVTKGWLRASHQGGHRSATPLIPGQIYQVEIPLQPIAYRFRQGNRIRVEVVNGDSPATDALFFHIYRPDKMGTDTIHHDAAHPSHLMLPVMPVMPAD
ncbi:MAG TPA: CocE/NonD family hydrolase [Stellaceae bacterium]|nr:CocE/NonD family hydrolase [Stellaceae bacterium]